MSSLSIDIYEVRNLIVVNVSISLVYCTSHHNVSRRRETIPPYYSIFSSLNIKKKDLKESKDILLVLNIYTTRILAKVYITKIV